MKKVFLIAGLAFFIVHAQGQSTQIGQESDQNVITTAVPFLQIGPDARSGGMGELGVSTTPDGTSMHWDPAKLAFIEKDFGFAVSYSPWLRNLVNDINLAYLSGYVRIDGKSSVGWSLKYFSLGDITFTDITGERIGDYRPNEFSIDGAYSRKFSDHVSGAVSARFIYSNLTQGQFVQGQATKAGTSIATDVAMFYTKELSIPSLSGSRLNFGVNISNIGAKISYSNDDKIKDFIPTNLRLGPTLSLDIDDYNTLNFSIDINKLLVPTPPIYATDSAGQPIYDDAGNRVIADGKDPNVSVVQGIIQSFYDAPDGFSEELKEFIWVLGAEYWYDKQFAVRAGYFHESASKGNRKFFTLGAGLRYNVFGLDFSYLIPTDQQNPLQNTLRFTLTFDFDAVRVAQAPEE
ncbi:MAG: type IX secretion system outer membrane channel protein PorV [Bacteroidales bacterium]|nr:type IX secretion system outer membrane channel protein PorV [Bacteroidales bacterium]